MISEIILLAVGIFILWVGADWFIKGGRIIAERVGISPLIIGLTIGAIGTSMPELIVSSMAAAIGKTSISIGNVVGSNIANIGLALGLGALVLPVPVEKEVIKYDYWVLLGSGILFYFFTRDSYMSSLEGIIFVVLFVAYFIFLAARQHFSKFKVEAQAKKGSMVKGAKFFILGLIGLTAGAKFIVGSASEIASAWGVTETIIGITVVAIGTSLPEIAVVVAGSLRKQPEISIGTIIGSNIINILLVAGLASIISPISLDPKEFIFQAPAVILFSLLLLPVIIDRKVKRFEGALLCFLYIGYVYLIF